MSQDKLVGKGETEISTRESEANAVPEPCLGWTGQGAKSACRGQASGAPSIQALIHSSIHSFSKSALSSQSPPTQGSGGAKREFRHECGVIQDT